MTALTPDMTVTPAALTPLTPAELVKDIRTLDRIEHDWLQEGRLDAITEEDIRYKRAELMDHLRERFTTGESERFGDWFAHEGNPLKAGHGSTELKAIEKLLELIGEEIE